MKNKILSILAAVVLIAVFFIPSYAADYYSSDESGKISIPEYIASISISEENVTIPESAEKNTYELTPEGNLKLVDDYYQNESETGKDVQSKQFLTVTTKSGNTFYIIVDRDGTNENVHFLNMVDEADLLALMGEEPTTEAPTESTTREEESTEESEKEPEKEKNSKSGLAFFLIVVFAGGGFAFYWFKVRNNGGKPQKPDNEETYDELGDPEENEEREEQ